MEMLLTLAAWPIAAILVSLGFFLVFKGPISALILRTRGIKGKNGAVDFGDIPGAEKQEQEQEQQKQIATTALQSVAALGPPSEVVAGAEERIRRSLNQDESDDLKQARLIRGFAIALLQKDFETIYRIIFGSQIDLLLAANAGGITRDRATEIFSQAAAIYPQVHQNANADMWMAFPKNADLISQDENGRITTTARGKEFLQYLVLVGLTSPKENG